MALRNILFAGLASSVSAVQILTSAYGSGAPGVNGTITTFDLSLGVGAATLKNLNAFDGAGQQPTWLDVSLGNDKVISLDEGWAGAASLSSIFRQKDGSLKVNNMVGVLGGPVAVQFYNKNTAIAVAHYGTGAISTFSYKDGTFTPMEQFKYSNATHGPRPEQADGSHVHHTVLDPTGQYLVFPDLGLDAVHVYCIDSKTNKITAHDDLKFPPAYGPRHAAFWKSGKDTYLFIIHELENKVTSHKVKYSSGGLSFEKVDEQSTFGPTPGNTTAGHAAEIAISPDNKFVIGSNRLSPRFNVDQSPSNKTQIPSDSLITFKPRPDGKLDFVQLAPSGGIGPRHFSLNKDGSLVGVGNQAPNPGDVASLRVYKRDVKSGKIGELVATSLDVGGSINNVRWLE
jgi:6-phosphogluconolactonase (cycloisomerase 2 family)